MSVLSTSSLALLALAYALGSLPFGLWVVKARCGIDVRTVGSGNIGTTNVMRAAGKGAAALVLACDMAKGALPVGLAGATGQPHLVVVGVALMAIVGHSRSVFLRFTGGKSVATGAGTVLVMAPGAAIAVMAVWAVLAALTRWVSVASMGAALALPAALWAAGAPRAYVVYGLAAAIYVLVRHRANMARLIAGKEPRL